MTFCNFVRPILSRQLVLMREWLLSKFQRLSQQFHFFEVSLLPVFHVIDQVLLISASSRKNTRIILKKQSCFHCVSSMANFEFIIDWEFGKNHSCFTSFVVGIHKNLDCSAKIYFFFVSKKSGRKRLINKKISSYSTNITSDRVIFGW